MIGLTGGVATGKSTVARMLQNFGAYLLDADTLARAVVAPGTPGGADIQAAFPEAIRNDGQIDRKTLAAIVFADTDKLRTLEKIIHPRVLSTMQRQGRVAEAQGEIVVCDIPLLFETNCQRWLEAVWVVYCDRKTQEQRFMSRNQIPLAQARKLIDHQMPIEEKRERAAAIIDNRGSTMDTVEQVRRLWQMVSGGP